MDPLSAAGIIMGGLTFPAQMFSSGVVAYTTISEVRQMGNSLGAWYWHFKQQEGRFIVWGMSHKACSPDGLDDTLMSQQVYQNVVTALTEITRLLEDKDTLCRRYGLKEVGQIQPLNQSIIKRESMRQQNMVKRLQKSSSLFRKVQWAIRDQGRFAELVQQLTTCIDTLHEQLPVPRGALLGEAVAAEILADTLINRGWRGIDDIQGTTDPQFDGLRAGSRAMRSAGQREENETFTVAQPIAPSPDLLVPVQQLEFLDSSSLPTPSLKIRSWARQRHINAFAGQEFLVVEWRRYDPQRGKEELKWILHRRIEALVRMLKEKPRTDSFRVFDCIGYFEDNLGTRFGLTFRLPNEYVRHRDQVPLSLSEAMALYPRKIPHLGARFRLAYLLAESVHALHAAGWLHKSIAPHNILLLQKQPRPAPRSPLECPISLESPYFTGFALSRPDAADSQSSKTAAEKEMQRYCHPDVQDLDGSAVAGYRATYDIFSLGTVLLEIGTWRTLSVWLKDASPNVTNQRHLLDRAVPYLGAAMGENYMDAVRKCLEGSFDRLGGFAESEYSSLEYKNNVRQGLLWEVVTVLRDCRA